MSCCCINFLVGIGSILLFIYLLAKHKFRFWKKHNVPFTPPSFPFGNCKGISRTKNLGDILKQTYQEGRGSPVSGFHIFFSPNLLVRDPNLVRQILTKDFSAFSGRGFKVDTDMDPLSGHLFFLEGSQWRSLRAKLTPAFTSGKMKMMLPIIQQCCKEMKSYLKSSHNRQNIFEAGELFTKYTTNVITRCAFGLDVDSFKNPDPMFEKMVHRVGNPTFLDAMKRSTAFVLGLFLTKLPLRLVPKELSDYFVELVDKTITQRQKSKEKKNDFLQQLIELINKGWLEDVDSPRNDQRPKLDFQFTSKEAAAQAFSFVLGGFDTSGTTMQCCLYELAMHTDIQKRAREEIQTVIARHGGQLSYESLQELVYLDQIINETLRMHPAVPFFTRECSRPYKVPDTQLLLEAGMKVWISTSGLHSDPDLFPQPEIFDPDRFSTENKSKIVPYSFLPFGEGPRACIGNRFAIMQIKAGLSSLLSEFVVRPCAKTQVPPLKFDPKKALALVLGGVTVEISPL